ncbi:MAG TPA: Clp protease N-terminal domain-containing protein [Streptosporangiaceae bacterium]|jgi:ATP-dependent Clp protease ATP-binding subunit ClpA|nr:Clp protease N-terminal domain-containing protein [Streptosporangiaceae bacterium]
MSEDKEPAPTPRYRRLLESAARLAREMEHPRVGAEHLLLAMVKDRDAVPAQVLAGMTNLDQVEARLREVMASDSYAGEPPARAEWVLACELPGLLPALAKTVPAGVKYGVNVVGDRAWVIVDKPGDTRASVTAARALLNGAR